MARWSADVCNEHHVYFRIVAMGHHSEQLVIGVYKVSYISSCALEFNDRP